MAQPSLDSFVGQSSQPSLDSFAGGNTSTAPQQSPSESIWSEISNQFNQGAKTFASNIDSLRSTPQGRPQDVQAALQGGGTGAATAEVLGQGLQMGEQGVETLGKAVGGLGTAALSPLAPILNKAAGLGSQIGNQLPENAALSFYNLTSNPAVERGATGAMNLANLAMPEVAKVGATALDTGLETAKTKIVGTPEEQAAAKIIANDQAIASQKATSAQQTKTIADQWKKPTTIPNASFNKARANLATSPGSPQFLAEQGIHPSSLIEDGRYVTPETAQALRDTAGKLSADSIRPSLQMADYTTPKTPVADITAATIKDIQNSKGATPGEMEAQIAKAKAEGAALDRKFPNGMSLVDMHDNKITYASKGGYSPVGDPNANNIAATNRAFGRTLASQVETKAPADVPVAEMNQYLSKYYKAADYLDSLNTKKAPVSIGQQIARGVAKFGGAGVGAHFGGGVVSAFAGYSIGKALEHALENLSGRAQATFINNLQHTNPEAFTKIQEYLKAQTSGNTGIPRLNPPSMIPLGPAQLGTTRDVVPQSDMNLSTPNTAPATTIPSTNAISSTVPELGQKSTPPATTPAPVSSSNPSMLQKIKNAIPPMDQRGMIKNPFSNSKVTVTPEVQQAFQGMHPEDIMSLKAVANTIRQGDTLNAKVWSRVQELMANNGLETPTTQKGFLNWFQMVYDNIPKAFDSSLSKELQKYQYGTK